MTNKEAGAICLPKYTLKETLALNNLILLKEKYCNQIDFCQIISDELKAFGIYADKPIWEANLEIGLSNKNLTSYFYPIKKEKILIGRSKNCGIILPLPRVSGKHAEIYVRNENYFIKDLGSLNGTKLNEETLNAFQSYELHSGDVITISDFTITFYKFIKKYPEIPIKLKFDKFNIFNSFYDINFILNNHFIAKCKLMDAEAPLILLIPKEIIILLSSAAAKPYAKQENPYSLIEHLICNICLSLNKKGFPIKFLKINILEKDIEIYLKRHIYAYLEIWTTISAQSLCFYLLIPEINKDKSYELDFAELPSFITEFPLIFQAKIGYTLLSLDSLSSLEEEDIILLDNCLFEDLQKESESPIKIISLSNVPIILEGILINKNNSLFLKVLNINKGGNNKMNDFESFPLEKKEKEVEKFLLKEVEILINVDLGNIKMTISDLMQLKKDQIIPLEKKITDEISLFVNNSLIGKGKLVDIDGKIGVKITSLFLKK